MEENWDVWFDKYYELRDQTRKLVRESAFKAAIISAVVEDLAEEMRAYLPIPNKEK